MNSRQNILFRSVRTKNPDKQIVSQVDGQLMGRLLVVSTLGHKRRNLLNQGHTSVQFSPSVVSNSLRPHGLQYTRPPCPSTTPELAQTHVHRVGDAIHHLILCRPLLLLPLIFLSIRVFSNESVLCIRWPKYSVNHYCV